MRLIVNRKYKVITDPYSNRVQHKFEIGEIVTCIESSRNWINNYGILYKMKGYSRKWWVTPQDVVPLIEDKIRRLKEICSE